MNSTSSTLSLSFLVLLVPNIALAVPTSDFYDVETVVTATAGERLLSADADADGTVYMADGSDTVYVLEAGSSTLDTFVSGAARDTDVVRVSPGGTIVVSGQPVTAWDSDGGALWDVDCGYGNPQGMGLLGDTLVYLANRYELCVIDGDAGSGSGIGSYGQIVQGVAVDQDTGDLYVSFGAFADSSTWSLESIDADDGSSLDTLAGAGDLYTNTGLDDDGDRGVLMADRSTQALVLVDDGGDVTELATGFTRIGDVSVGLDGYIYVTDPGTSTVYRLDRDADADGVDGLEDTCADTDGGTVVDSEGCSGQQVVDNTCGEPSDYKNHGRYVSCVAHAVNGAVAAGLLTNKEGAAIKKAAARK